VRNGIKALQRLLTVAVAITYPDRLARFGFEAFRDFFLEPLVRDIGLERYGAKGAGKGAGGRLDCHTRFFCGEALQSVRMLLPIDTVLTLS